MKYNACNENRVGSAWPVVFIGDIDPRFYIKKWHLQTYIEALSITKNKLYMYSGLFVYYSNGKKITDADCIVVTFKYFFKSQN